MISEATFMAHAERALNDPSSPVRVWRANSADLVVETARHGKRRIRGARKGTGDFVGWVRGSGRYFELELKSADGSTSEAQRNRERALHADGCGYEVVRADKYSIEKSIENVWAVVRERIMQ